MLDRIEVNNKRFSFKYRKNPIYAAIQKMDVRTFDTISKKDPDYVWELLKYLSSSLEKLNREYIQQVKNNSWGEPFCPYYQSFFNSAILPKKNLGGHGFIRS